MAASPHRASGTVPILCCQAHHGKLADCLMDAASMARSRRTASLASLIAITWLAAMVIAFWWFEARYLRPFDDRTTLFQGAELRLPARLAGLGEIRLVHRRGPACPCNVGNQQHLVELTERYSARGVSVHVMQKPGADGQLADPLQDLQALRGLTGNDNLPARPWPSGINAASLPSSALTAAAVSARGSNPEERLAATISRPLSPPARPMSRLERVALQSAPIARSMGARAATRTAA